MKIKITIILMLFISFFANSQEVKYINANSLNIRKGAGKDFEVIAKVNKNIEVTVLSENDNWVKIQTENGTVGFVSSEYLTASKQDENLFKEYVITPIIVGILLILAFFRLKKLIGSPFKKSTSRNITKKRTPEKVITKTEQISKSGKQTLTVQKEIKSKVEFLCKNCGSEYGSIASLTTNNCKNTNGKHQLYEGTIKSQYVCKHCGSKYNSIFQMTINNCKKSPTGKHQPAL